MDRASAVTKASACVAQMSVEEAASQLRFDSPGIARMNIPEYNWWNEGLHGVARAGTATIFPQAIGLAATFDICLIRQVADIIATEGRAKYNESKKHGDRDIYKGLTCWAPNVNIFRDPRWGRGHETYGEDPFLTAQMAVAFIKGLQGEGDGVPFLKLAACAKHFAVHSGPEDVRHEFNAVVSDKDLWETYLPAFEACVVQGHVESVMGAYNRTNGQACCAHPLLMTQILREQWGFAGHYVSDCWAIRDFYLHHHLTQTMEESAAMALNAGCDLNCGCAYQQIMKAYAYGEVDEKTIRKSAIRLYTTRFLLGMFESTPYDDIPYEVVECKEHLAMAEKAAQESIVLLKNDGILPLEKGAARTIGVVGPNANNRNALIGNYYGTASRYVTVLEGIQDSAPDDVRILYSEGCHLSLDKPDPLSRADHRLSEAAAVAEHSDVVIVCLGLDEHLEGEEGDAGNQYASGDKKDLALPKPQQRLLTVIEESKKPYILCVLAGSALDLSQADQSANAILQVWYPGARGGKSVADILFGDASPSGKLPITLYRDLKGMPAFTDYAMRGRTYRYLTQEPLYPFGYGLTYGRMEMLEALCDSRDYAAAARQGVSISTILHNPTHRILGEVLQVYVRVHGTTCEVENHRLCAFERVSLLPGETREITLFVAPGAFETVRENGARMFDGTGATLSVGFGQPDARTQALTKQFCAILTLE